MQNDSRRITLVARHPGNAGRDWDHSNPIGSRIIFVDSLAFLPHAIERGIQAGYDLQRVIIDGTGTPMQFLDLIASLPHEFAGDVLFVSPEGRTFLSSPGRGDGRVLYALCESDLEFYLQTSGLLWGSFEEAMYLGHVANP
jgi:hypothetical protein